MLKIQVGYNMKSKVSAQKITTKFQSLARKEGRLGNYIVEFDEDAWKAFHVLTEEERLQELANCKKAGRHTIHAGSGRCTRCHSLEGFTVYNRHTVEKIDYDHNRDRLVEKYKTVHSSSWNDDIIIVPADMSKEELLEYLDEIKMSPEEYVEKVLRK